MCSSLGVYYNWSIVYVPEVSILSYHNVQFLSFQNAAVLLKKKSAVTMIGKMMIFQTLHLFQVKMGCKEQKYKNLTYAFLQNMDLIKKK